MGLALGENELGDLLAAPLDVVLVSVGVGVVRDLPQHLLREPDVAALVGQVDQTGRVAVAGLHEAHTVRGGDDLAADRHAPVAEADVVPVVQLDILLLVDAPHVVEDGLLLGRLFDLVEVPVRLHDSYVVELAIHDGGAHDIEGLVAAQDGLEVVDDVEVPPGTTAEPEILVAHVLFHTFWIQIS